MASVGLDSLANRLAGFAQPIAAEFFVVSSWNFDVNINAVKDGTRDAFLRFGDDSGGASGQAWAGLCQGPSRPKYV